MKYISYIRYGLLAISVLITLMFLGTMDESTGDFPYIDLLLNWTYALLFIGVGVVVILPTINMAKNPKAAIRSFAGIGLVLAILGICYAVSSDSPITAPDGQVFVNVMELKLSDTGLYATYAAFTVALLAIIGGEVMKLFRK